MSQRQTATDDVTNQGYTYNTYDNHILLLCSFCTTKL